MKCSNYRAKNEISFFSMTKICDLPSTCSVEDRAKFFQSSRNLAVFSTECVDDGSHILLMDKHFL